MEYLRLLSHFLAIENDYDREKTYNREALIAVLIADAFLKKVSVTVGFPCIEFSFNDLVYLAMKNKLEVALQKFLTFGLIYKILYLLNHALLDRNHCYRNIQDILRREIYWKWIKNV